MTIWSISTRVNNPENDDPSILDRVAEPVDWQAPLDRKAPVGEPAYDLGNGELKITRMT
jgi:hypothetical protein